VEEPTQSTPSARFDDLRPHRRRSFALTDPEQVLVAATACDVSTMLEAAEAAVAAGKWVAGFVSYEAAPAFDPALEVVPTASTEFEGLPAAWFAVFSDRAPADDEVRRPYSLGEWEASVDEMGHREAIHEIQHLIRHGHTYQVNHTFGLSASFDGDARDLYRELAASQTCGYGAFLDTGRWQIASASPELFFEWDGERIVCRPMKGTARRGPTTAGDEARRLELLASEKDRAENVMIVDMVRNDLGRIAEMGSVEAPVLFTAEKYDTVWQLTSTVTARTRRGSALADVFRALFPSASITGAPKVSTMSIIRRLEGRPRGVYCGAIGFGGPGSDGRPEWAFNVAIRTVLVDTVRGRAHYGTGGGITIDSTAAGEYGEALLKTEVLARRTARFSLLESMAWYPDSGVWLLDRHLDRLLDSAWYFDIPVERATVEMIVKEEATSLVVPSMLRLLVDRAGGVSIVASELPGSRRVRLVVDDRPVHPDDPFLYHKTTNRAVYDAAGERNPEVVDVVLWNPAGEVTETTIGNLAVLVDVVWWTPPVSSGCLPGTYRAELLENGEIREGVVTLENLRRAKGIARINSVRGWEPAELV
jgi:para-aminobenzoate synthetase/4-amino-4-deoxychorismate lyase